MCPGTIAHGPTPIVFTSEEEFGSSTSQTDDDYFPCQFLFFRTRKVDVKTFGKFTPMQNPLEPFPRYDRNGLEFVFEDVESDGMPGLVVSRRFPLSLLVIIRIAII